LKPGAKAKLTVLRKSQETSLAVTVGKRPMQKPAPPDAGDNSEE
jgi:hypothetical protein